MNARNTIDSYAFIETGLRLRAMLYTASSECRSVLRHMDQAVSALDTLNFTYPRNQLQAVGRKLDEVTRSKGESTLVPEETARELRTVIECILDTIKSQASERRLLTLEPAAVSTKLRELAKQGTLNARQTYLFLETVISLETGAYRSAVVMGWNLAYDIIRQWVFEDPARLGSFNSELAKFVDKSGKPRFAAVAEYADFYEIGEKMVLDVCRGANLLGGNSYDNLRTHLRQRNLYAHASDAHPTVHQANGLLDHLIDDVTRLVTGT